MDWTPTAPALFWGATAIKKIDQGCWLVTANGFYSFDHSKQEIKLIARSPEFDAEQWEKHRATFAALGYTLSE